MLLKERDHMSKRYECKLWLSADKENLILGGYFVNYRRKERCQEVV